MLSSFIVQSLHVFGYRYYLGLSSVQVAYCFNFRMLSRHPCTETSLHNEFYVDFNILTNSPIINSFRCLHFN